MVTGREQIAVQCAANRVMAIVARRSAREKNSVATEFSRGAPDRNSDRGSQERPGGIAAIQNSGDA